MNIIKEWYSEAELQCPVHDINKETFIIRRGFRLTRNKSDESYRIQDIRRDENYSSVSESDLAELTSRGFIKGCDYIGFNRDTKESLRLKKLIETLYSRRKKITKLLKRRMIKEERLRNEKRVRNINKNIDIYVDQIFLYKSQIEQFNNKYNKLNT